MFPGYLFVQGEENGLRRVMASSWVLRMLFPDARSERRLVEDLNSVRIMCRALRANRLQIRPEIVEGVRVLLEAGPLRGMSGVVVRRQKATRVTVNVELIGQSVTVDLDVADLDIEG